MTRKIDRRHCSETELWLEERDRQRAEATRIAALQRQPVDGMYLIQLPSIADALDGIERRSQRAAGRNTPQLEITG